MAGPIVVSELTCNQTIFGCIPTECSSNFARDTMLKENVISPEDLEFIPDAATAKEALEIIQRR